MSSPPRPEMCFRDFVNTLRNDDDLIDIDVEVNPHLEVSGITRKAIDTKDKAPLFNNVKGSKNGLFRILGAPGCLSKEKTARFGRVARHLGLPRTATPSDMIDKILSAKSAKPIPPTIVETGTCKENKLFGDDIDLDQIPVPMLHNGDGGRYLQTYGMHVVRSPSTGWTSWSLQRAHVHDKRSLVGVCVDPEHIGTVFNEWKAKGEDMPWALALGVPPAAIMAASMPLPKGVSEGDYVGAITGQSIDVVKCETNDLYVPANSEIVLEGRVSITKTADEGPFGEMHGYVFPADKVPGMPIFEVECITYRNDAILPICVAGRAVDETHTLIGIPAAAEIKHILETEGLPIKGAFTPFETHIVWVVLQVDTAKLRSMRTTSEEFCRKIGEVLFRKNMKTSWFLHRIVLVGDDIDIYNFEEVMWAYATRCRPGMDEYLFDDVPGFFLVPFMGHGQGDMFNGGKVVSNCLLPVEYTDGQNWITCDFRRGWPVEVQNKVNKIWSQLGY